VVRLALEHDRAGVRGMKRAAGIAHLLADNGPLLLDFDGPICGVFAGYPAVVIASELRRLIASNGTPIPGKVAQEADPLQILHWTTTLQRPDVIDEVERTLCAAELRAIETAAPTPFAREVIVAAKQAGRDVAIVSNNSAPAINAYLTVHRLAHYVSPVVGRVPGRPDLMKPNPEPVLRAVNALGADSRRCLLVGDSVTDVTSARAANVRVVGFANRPAKVSRLTEAGADAVVTSMGDLATHLLDALPR